MSRPIAWLSMVVGVLLVLFGFLMGWPIVERQPGVWGALPFWAFAAALMWAAGKALRKTDR